MSRNLVKVEIPYLGVKASALIEVLGNLPPGAVVVRAYEYIPKATTCLIVEHNSFPAVPEACEIPEWEIGPQPRCTCDALYVGYRGHLPYCALNGGKNVA